LSACEPRRCPGPPPPGEAASTPGLDAYGDDPLARRAPGRRKFVPVRRRRGRDQSTRGVECPIGAPTGGRRVLHGGRRRVLRPRAVPLPGRARVAHLAVAARLWATRGCGCVAVAAHTAAMA